MITAKMTSNEVRREARKSVLKLSSFLQHERFKFDRDLRKMQLPASRVVSVTDHTHMQDYLIILYETASGYGDNIYAVVKGKRGKMFYQLLNIRKTGMISAYREHFFSRYAERTGRERKFPDIIGEFAAYNPLEVRLYEDKEQGKVVYACNEGIMLGDYDLINGFVVYNTFVPERMMGHSQRKAYKVISCNMDKICDMFRDALYSEDIQAKFDEIDIKTEEIRDFSQEIYAKYYENGEKK